MPSAEVSRKPVNAAAVLVMVLGSRTVAMLATHNMSTHGAKAYRLAKVSCGPEFDDLHVVGMLHWI